MGFFFSQKDTTSLVHLIRQGEKDTIAQIYQKFYLEILEVIDDEIEAQGLLKRAILTLRSLILANKIKDNFDVRKFLVNWCKKQYEETKSDFKLEQKIYDSLKANDGWAFYYINMTYAPSVVQYVKLHGGSKEDGEDIVQDAILILINNINEGKYQLRENTKIKTYFIGICKNLWKERLRKGSRIVPFSNLDYFDLEDYESYDYLFDSVEEEQLNDRQRIVQKAYEMATDTCKKVLGYFYFKNYSHEEIADVMGFSNAESSKTQKNKCLKKLKITVSKSFNQN